VVWMADAKVHYYKPKLRIPKCMVTSTALQYLIDEEVCAVHVDSGVKFSYCVNTDSIYNSNAFTGIARSDGVTAWHTSAKLAYGDHLNIGSEAQRAFRERRALHTTRCPFDQS